MILWYSAGAWFGEQCPLANLNMKVDPAAPQQCPFHAHHAVNPSRFSVHEPVELVVDNGSHEVGNGVYDAHLCFFESLSQALAHVSHKILVQ